jgi:hypothetical protein
MRTRRAVLAAASSLAIASGVILASCGSSPPQKPSSSPTTTTSSPPRSSTSAPTTTVPPAAALSPPPIPTNSVYLGAWVNPNQLKNGAEAGSQEVAQLPAFTSTIGGEHPAILHVYTPFMAPLPIATLDSIVASGATPMIDWSCANVQSIVSGAQDSVIQSYAESLKSFAKPVFLRWYWEFNQNTQSAQCGALADPAEFVAAWQHIWTIFHQVGASNVAFVWCPGLSGGNFAAFYPGDQYVDWIGIDAYDRSFNGRTAGDFAGIFGAFYDEWAGHGKPMVVAETGAIASQQTAYLQSIESQAPTMPLIKAIIYFDAVGPAADWSLQGAGATTFQSLLSSPYFSFRASS